MSENLTTTLAKAEAALRLPPSALRIYELTQLEGTSLEELVNLAQVDPTFVSTLLRLANSPTYTRGTEVTSIDIAISRLGFKEVGQLAIVLATAKEFSKMETDLLRSSSYWSHSVTTAVLARKKARACKLSDSGIFVAGLLHDLALPIQFSLCGDEMIRALDISIIDDDISLLSAESQMLGFNHTELGSQLAELWKLPSIVIETIRHHHEPEAAEQHREAVAVVAWANIVESLGTSDDSELTPAMQLTLEQANSILSLTSSNDDALLEEAQHEAVDMLELF